MKRTTQRILREIQRVGKKVFRKGCKPTAEPLSEGSTSLSPTSPDTDPAFWARKARKLAKTQELLKTDQIHSVNPRFFDFLTDDLRKQFSITDTSNVSSHDYDGDAQKIIHDYADGVILDCGAGFRRVYFDNVVNFEICDYVTTDVRGVGERLPFRDGVFDAVFSFNVLEHVTDPFACAHEIVRVLKPGGRLYCVVPFLQPFHAYPHHYYNMTHMGLRNLFAQGLDVELQEVNGGGLPIFTLTWILQRWLDSLPERTRKTMKKMTVAELARNPLELWHLPFVKELPVEANLELASTTSLFARKPSR